MSRARKTARGWQPDLSLAPAAGYGARVSVFACGQKTEKVVGDGVKVYGCFVKPGSNVVTDMAGSGTGNGSGQAEKARTGERGMVWIFGVGFLLAVAGCLMACKKKKKK